MSWLVFFIGIAVALEAHSTSPGIWVGTALIVAGLLAGVLEEKL